MLQRRPEWRNALLYAFATGALCTGISGLHQYFFGFREMRAFLAEQLAAGQEISPVLQAKIADTRVYATFVSCNALAGFLLLLLPVAIWAAAQGAAAVRVHDVPETAQAMRAFLNARDAYA